jgi:hypothetical protein
MSRHKRTVKQRMQQGDFALDRPSQGELMDWMLN